MRPSATGKEPRLNLLPKVDQLAALIAKMRTACRSRRLGPLTGDVPPILGGYVVACRAVPFPHSSRSCGA